MSLERELFVGYVANQQMPGLRPLKHPPSLPRKMQRQHNGPYCFQNCPIREISVERRGTRVKRFFVSEDVSSELKNLTEYRQSGTPGDFTGAVFLVLFYTKKVLGEFCVSGFGAKPRKKAPFWWGIKMKSGEMDKRPYCDRIKP
jgi:hypothetical protein